MRDGGSALATWRRLMRLAILLQSRLRRLSTIGKSFRPFSALGPFGTREALLPIVTLTAILPAAAITAVAAVTILAVIAVVTAMTLALLLTALVTRAAIVETLAIIVPRLTLVAARGLRLRHGAEIAAHFVAILVAELIAHRAWLAERTAVTHAAVLHIAAALSDLLLAEGHDDAVVVLGMLEIVLGENGISARLRVSRKRQILLGNMGGRAADLDVGPGALEAPRQRVLTPAVLVVVVIIVVAAATSAVLLSLPHRLRSRWL
jgi:hypothetical protein